MIKQAKLSDVITERLESMIIDGTLVAGEKLLPERELACQFQVSRPSLREAIQNLQAKGLIQRKQGGGTFVSSHLNKRLSDPILELISKRPETQFDLLEFRHSLEGMAAFYAALRGNSDDHKTLTEALDNIYKIDYKHQPEKEAEALVDFYAKMAKASQNMVLMQIMQAIRLMLIDNIRQNLNMLRQGLTADHNIESTIAKHRADIVAAIVAKNPEAARDASHTHLSYVEKTLLEINKNQADVQRSMRRIVSKD